METEERISAIEKQMEKYDLLILALVKFASKSAKGRLLLTAIGIPRELWPS
jgi:hypothetical protein